MAKINKAASEVQPWTLDHLYAVGDVVTYQGKTYQALQSARSIATWAPALVLALWKPLTDTTPPDPPKPTPEPPKPGTTYVPAWAAQTVYTAGMTATQNGMVYKANWWTQGNGPATNSGGAGSGQPWTLVGPAKTVTAVPTVPTGLAASMGPNSASLTWAAATVPGGGEVTGYTIYANGQKVGTSGGTGFVVRGLAPATAYTFAVTAEDVAGSSARSAAVTATTAKPRPPGQNIPDHVFAPYIDMGLTVDSDLVGISRASGVTTFTLAFLQSSGPGTVGWSGVGRLTDDQLAGGTTTVLAQVQALRDIGGDVIISFGGAAGTDPAAIATSAAQLQAEYQSAIDRYGVTSLDFDIEGAQVADLKAVALRDQALLGLRAANPNLAISFTLPVLPDGLDGNGLRVLQAAKRDGLTPDVVNIMAMDYGASVDNGGRMGQNAIDAARATIAQMRTIGLTSKLGITPMIGVNDVATEVFTLADAEMLLSFAVGNPDVARLSMWSIARDNGNSAGSNWASPDSSGLAQAPFAFAATLKGF